jgi:hypothetical protein
MSSLSSLAQYFSSIQQSVVQNQVQTQVLAKTQSVQKQTGEAIVELIQKASIATDTGKGFDGFA